MQIVDTMTWEETYELLVYHVEATFTDRKGGANHIKDAMKVIVDLKTNDELSLEANTQLQPKIYYFYRWILHYFDIEENRKLLIYQINKFTERHKGDLTTFVNSIPWVDGCVPYNWAMLSGQSKFDTSEWIVCS